MRALVPLEFPLTGASLIEASAGTGKTYTIVNLYLRLLLGHGCRALNIEQILVVTFTVAATAELKSRVRDKLNECYLDFYRGHSEDPFIQSLIEQLPDTDIACRRLAMASKQMDEAAIFTIHGFCQRMLTQHAFESGAMYEQSFILDESDWRKLAADDYWRKHIVLCKPELLALLLKIWSGPGELLSEISPLLSRQISSVSTLSVTACSEQIEQYARQVKAAKRWWLDNDISRQLSQAKLSGTSPLSKTPMLAAIDAFCQGNGLLPDFHKEGWALLGTEKINKGSKKDTQDLCAFDFEQFDRLHETLQRCKQNIRLAFCSHALEHIRANLASHKSRLQLLAPDDLLSCLQQALQNEQQSASQTALANSIQTLYPAALIDEFQDTDPVQYQVFSAIYARKDKDDAACWIMIGDPKQAIYAFRGADIHTYIEAKRHIPADKQFTLDSNWRSQQALVEVINGLFQHSRRGFLFEQEIPFYPVKAAKDIPGFEWQGREVKGLSFHHLCSEDGTPLSWSSAQYDLASHCAGQISQLLSSAAQGQAVINSTKDSRVLQAGDCCVLVRDRNEADLIKQALFNQGIASVFLEKKSVFATQMALDLLALLQAIANPNNERLLRSALLSELFAFDATEVETLFNDELAWQQLVEHCFEWQKQWQKQGLMLVLNQLCRHFDLYRLQVAHYVDGIRRLTDLRHLSELLQQQSVKLHGEAQLLHWFEERVAEPDNNHEGQQLRLDTDANLVQIMTQHSAKGLEFPLVFIPFACRFREAKQAIFHTEQGLKIDFLGGSDNMQKADNERLAEDIRLLYVALTRAVYYCQIGVWNAALGTSKKFSGLPVTALGSLLFAEQSDINDDVIESTITTLSANLPITYQQIDTQQLVRPLQPSHSEKDSIPLQHAVLKQTIRRQWRLTSYSAISSAQQHAEVPRPGMDEGRDSAVIEDDQLLEPSAFSFQKGAKAGSFLHGVLENIDFQNPGTLSEVIARQGSWYGILENDYPMLEHWLSDVLLAKFSENGDNALLSLSGLTASQVKVEMEFHMPLSKVGLSAFNRLINQFKQQRGRQYQFDQLNGMLKGFIDLTFEYQGKYYVADYKSNHLGNSLDCYQEGALESAMSEHDYHLQAILYTLALHRFLKQNLSDYTYATHIGGAYYLFLRGMSSHFPGSGIYYYRPEQHLIEALDMLFSGQQPAMSPQQGQLDLC